jgi:alpha-L-fucosidase
MKKLILFCFAIAFSLATMAQNSNISTSSKQNDSRMQWWKDAKFGIFIHWGIYSVPAGKWGDKTS